MKRLKVYLNSEHVGILEQDDSGLLLFAYDPAWLERGGAIPLSRSLPLRQEDFRGKYARPFFAGILPEEDPRKRIASILGISERNDFAMLERIGGECVGAVSLFPEEVRPSKSADLTLRELTSAELGDVLEELPRRPLMAGTEGVRLSLAGAQGKLPVLIRDGRVFLPLGNAPSSHIMKPEPERFPGLATNELLCMRLATAVGLNVPEARVETINSQPVLIVERYDRFAGDDGQIVRIHQEDFCQALGFPPERKYQQEGGPLLRECIALLREWSTAPVLDIRSLIDGLMFNMLIGNADAHGKNYSLLYPAGENRLAPFYDLVCTLAWPEVSDHLSMKIGGCKTLKEIEPAHWQKMAKETNLGWPMVRERLAQVSQNVLDALEPVHLEIGASEMSEKVVGIIRHRAERLLSQLKQS